MKLPNRIYIIGTAGSGKGWLSSKLSSKLNIPEYNLDDVYWIKKYTKKRSEKNRLKKLEKIIKNKEWILEGVYGSWIKKAIRKADLVIWLDPPFRVLSWRIFVRYLKRKRLGSKSDNLKGTLGLIKYAGRYKKKNNEDSSSYKIHKEIIDNHKVNFVIIKNKKQLRRFIGGLE